MAFPSTPVSTTWHAKPKMSLVAQYDDLCRYTKVLTSAPEEEFKVFVENQLSCVQKWKESESEVKTLNDKMSNLLFTNRRLETQIEHLKNLVEEAVNKRRKVELEKNSLERQIALIKEVLLADGVMDNHTKEKLGFLSSCKASLNSPPRLDTIDEAGSLLSLSDIDRTDEDFDGIRQSRSHVARQSKEKRSSSESRISLKKKKLESIDQESASDSNEVNENNFPYIPVTIRSSSEPASSSPDRPTFPHPVHKSDSAQIKNHPYELRRCNTGGFAKSTPVSRYSAGGKLSRTHLFIIKTLYRPEKCHPCQSSIGFIKQALKCQDCRVICHPECKDQCPLPCIPVVNTPTKGSTGLISDYTSSTPPMIPPLIVYCVNEIESRGLRDIGLYRIPGSEREVKLLKEKFLNGRSIPCLFQTDVHALCGTIKEFLRSLKEPLITHSAWQDFVNAACVQNKSESLKAIHDMVVDLPQPNRDTLAFLVLHLQRVADSPDCKMPISSLARMLGPTIVGYSVPEPADMNMFKETEEQCKVMERLLSIPSDSWKSLLNVETDVFIGNSVRTPEAIPAPKGTRLGPIYPPGQKSKGSGKTPLATRNSKFNRSGKMPFSSPRLK